MAMKHLVVLLPLLAISLPCFAGEATQLVYDTEGHELSSDSNYYILPVDRGIGDGLRNFIDASERCRCFVGTMQRDELAVRFPVRIKPPTDGTVGLSTNVTIRFQIITTCVQTFYWYVTYLSPMSSLERQHVATGKMESEDAIPPSVFRIERYGDATEGYKLVWCTDEGPCKNLGFYASMETNWLVITSDSPLAVVFKKANA